MGKREHVTLLCLSSMCLVIYVWLFLAVPRLFLQFLIVLCPDHTHYFCMGYYLEHLTPILLYNLNDNVCVVDHLEHFKIGSTKCFI